MLDMFCGRDSIMHVARKRLSSTLLCSILVYTVAVLLCFSAAFTAFFFLTQEKDEELTIAMIAQNAAQALNNADIFEQKIILQDQFEEGIRYTLIDEQGDVIFDSDGKATENHANRPEFIEALEKGYSSVTRYSETLGQDTVYAAVHLSSGAVLRLSEQRESYLAVFESTAPALGVAALVALVLSIALSRALSRRVVSPLNNVDVASPLDNETYEEMHPLLLRIETQQRQLKDQNLELARAENLRREFSANVSHELKTPLQVISGYAELLSQGDVPHDMAKDFARIILSESDGMKALINDVLVLSRLDDPVMENAGKEAVELLELAHEVTVRFAPLAEKRSVQLRCLGSTVVVNGNRGLLDQLISNLVSNAINYSDPGGDVVLSVGKMLATPGSDLSGQAFVKVKDTGCGIPVGEQEKIFERFYRVDKSRSKDNGGTGLGLAIAKHAAAFHGATITVDSEPGRGSVFTVKIPLNH